MPADRKEQIRKLPSGKYQLRYLDRKGVRRPGGVSPPSRLRGRTTATKSHRDSAGGRSPGATSPSPISSTCSSSDTRPWRNPARSRSSIGGSSSPRRSSARSPSSSLKGNQNRALEARGAAHRIGARRARPCSATARQPLRVHDLPEVSRQGRTGAVRCRELPAPRMGTGDRFRGRRNPGQAIRPPVDVRLKRARGGDHDVRARADHGTSGKMIERHYGTLIDTAHDAILTRLESQAAR